MRMNNFWRDYDIEMISLLLVALLMLCTKPSCGAPPGVQQVPTDLAEQQPPAVEVVMMTTLKTPSATQPTVASQMDSIKLSKVVSTASIMPNIGQIDLSDDKPKGTLLNADIFDAFDAQENLKVFAQKPTLLPKKLKPKNYKILKKNQLSKPERGTSTIPEGSTTRTEPPTMHNDKILVVDQYGNRQRNIFNLFANNSIKSAKQKLPDPSENSKQIEPTEPALNSEIKPTTTSTTTSTETETEKEIAREAATESEITRETATATEREKTRETATATATTTTTANKDQRAVDLPVLSTTVFEVPEQFGSKEAQAQATTQAETQRHSSIKMESQISDIQIEVYDSTIDSIVASTNFKDSYDEYALQQKPLTGTIKPRISTAPLERFTQYVIDPIDESTQRSFTLPANILAVGVPEPAAIEIHINVSESFGNGNDEREIQAFKREEFGSGGVIKNQTKNADQQRPDINSSRGHSLLKKIIDSVTNSTDITAVSAENRSPIFTFRTDSNFNSDLDYIGIDIRNKLNDQRPPPPPSPTQVVTPVRKNLDRDSDTIFYISNTEVKVSESMPTTNPNSELKLLQRKFKLGSQFFPVNYTLSALLNTSEAPTQPERFEEDIILSPAHNTSNSLKIYRNEANTGGTSGEAAPPLDVTYVGESIIEVEQSDSTTAAPIPATEVILQSKLFSGIAIGIPIIGELPQRNTPKPNPHTSKSANQNRKPADENANYDKGYEIITIGSSIATRNSSNANYYSLSSKFNENHLIDSSIQYGGDLIDDGASGGFDGPEIAYPFGNPESTTVAHQLNAHPAINPDVNNLHKNELSVDELSNEAQTAKFLVGAADEKLIQTPPNATESIDLDRQNQDRAATNTERNGPFSTLDVTVGLMIITLPVVVFLIIFCSIRLLLNKNGICNRNNQQCIAESQSNGCMDNDYVSNNLCPLVEAKKSNDKESVFVVEMAYSDDANKLSDKSPHLPKDPEKDSNEPLTNYQQVQIHTPPKNNNSTVNGNKRNIYLIENFPDDLKLYTTLNPSTTTQEAEENHTTEEAHSAITKSTMKLQNCYTGLSQSDLSSTSSSDSNKLYTYGTQDLYTPPTVYEPPLPITTVETTYEQKHNKPNCDDEDPQDRKNDIV